VYAKHGVTFRLECIGEAIGIRSACVQITDPARVPCLLMCSHARDFSSFFRDRVRGKREIVAFFQKEVDNSSDEIVSGFFVIRF
jgi:hypothetical protein